VSLISKALKKVQESRQNHIKDKPKEIPKNNNIVYLSDAPQSWPRTALMAIVILSSLGAIFISMAAISMTMKNSESKQVQVFNLERTIRNQEKKINELMSTVNRNQKYDSNKMRDLIDRMNAQKTDMTAQINNLSSTQSSRYSNLKDAIVDDKEEINLLNTYAKNLNSKIDKVSAAQSQSSDSQTKDLTVPAAGN
jgi:hypothetical protein